MKSGRSNTLPFPQSANTSYLQQAPAVLLVRSVPRVVAHGRSFGPILHCTDCGGRARILGSRSTLTIPYFRIRSAETCAQFSGVRLESKSRISQRSPLKKFSREFDAPMNFGERTATGNDTC